MGEIVSYRSNGGTSEGYLALPADDGKLDAFPPSRQASGSPAVIVIQEWWGLVPHIRSLADRFADAGFVALAPDLYHGVHTSEPDEAGKLLMGLRMDQAAKDIAGAAAYLAARPETDGKIGTVGFCMGGSLALWSGTLSDQISSTVGFYPAVPWERMAPHWDNYAGKAAMIHCSEGDGTSAAPGIVTAVGAISAAGGSVKTFDYPRTQHAFFNDDRPEVYDVDASVTSWARTLDFLRATLA